MKLSIHRSLTAVLIGAASIVGAPSRAAGNVLVVSKSGGAPYTEIKQAHDAAQDGDIILVKPGSYGFLGVGKSITIIGDTTQIGPPITVAGVTMPIAVGGGPPLTANVVLRNLTIVSSGLGGQFSSLLFESQGWSVLLEDWRRR